VNGRRAETRIDSLLDLFMLTEVANVRVAEYSTGMRQKLSIARGLLSEPRLLFLDEPTRGLDPAAAHNLLQLVRDRAVRHLENTVILTTHIAREVEQLCDRIATLNRGRVDYVGSVEGLVATLDETVGYSLVLDALPDAVFSALRGKAGVTECTPNRREDGSIELELTLAYEGALSEVLRQLLFNNVTITRCTVRETSLEDTFRTVFGRTAPRPADVPATSSPTMTDHMLRERATPGAGVATRAQYLDFNAARASLSRRRPAFTSELRYMRAATPWFPRGRVLDIACGPGVFSEFLAEQGADVWGLDFDHTLVASAQRRLSPMALGSAFVVARVEQLPYRDGTFDACVADSLLEHVPIGKRRCEKPGACCDPAGCSSSTTANRLHPFTREINHFPFYPWLPARLKRVICATSWRTAPIW
jgi:ABC-type uncharacterized transport system ATPase subunit